MDTNQVLPQPHKAEAESTDRFANRLLTELHRAVISQEPGAIEGRIEAIHDMRVAIRRLRVALSNFAVCLTREDRRRLRESLERLGRTLGRVRDLDVMIGALEDLRLSRPANEQPAIDSLLKRLIARRRRNHRLLVKYLQGEEFGAFKVEFPAPQQISELPHTLEQQNVESPLPENHGQAA
jgi:CHAD domain-containing protein